MATPRQRFRFGLRAAALGMILSAAGASIAFGQRPDLKPLIAKVDPAIVRISTDLGNGWGVVVDAAKGWVATNYHVMAGTTDAHVAFAGDNDRKTYAVEGLVATMPGKDLALIRIKSGDKKLDALKIAEKPAAKGDAVFGGVPLGFPGVLSSGSVAAVSSGREVGNLIAKLGDPAYYSGRELDADAVWLQVKAAISPGKDGRPLVNAAGELVGLMTFRYDTGPGDNLNYAVSAAHLKRLMATAGTKVQPLAKPLTPLASEFAAKRPAPFPTKRIVLSLARGDPDRTLAAWKALNKALVELLKKADESRRRWEAIPPADPKQPSKGLHLRTSRTSTAYKMMARAYRDYAAAIKGVVTSDSDPDLFDRAATESKSARAISEHCDRIVQGLGAEPEIAGTLDADWGAVERAGDSICVEHFALRIALSLKYGREFQALEDAAAEADAARNIVVPAIPAPGNAGSNDRGGFRVWTSRNGRFQVKAKFLGVSDGKIMLERTDGTVVKVPIDMLSEADQRFLVEPSPPQEPAKQKPAK